MRRAAGTIALGLVVVVLATAIVTWQRPDVWLQGTAAAVTLEALDVVTVPWFASDVRVETTTVGGVTVDRHVADEQAPVVVLVPGATPHGRADPRTVEVAHAMARRGRTVVIPELDVYTEQLVSVDVDRLVNLVEALSGGDTTVTLVGISFGGSLALLAASNLEVAARGHGDASSVALVATFGAYVDLIEVAKAVIVGESRVGNQTLTFEPDARARDVVRTHVLNLLGPSARELVEKALAGDLDRRLLPEDLGAVVDLLEATTSLEATDATRRLPASLVAQLHQVSPVRIGDGLDAPVVAMHARHDPVIPFAELLRLGRQLPQAQLLVLENFGHVDPEEDGRWRDTIGDVRTAWRFAHAVLQAGT